MRQSRRVKIRPSAGAGEKETTMSTVIRISAAASKYLMAAGHGASGKPQDCRAIPGYAPGPDR